MTDAENQEALKKAHRQEKEIEVAASIEGVWSALTEGKKLANWFPLEARVTSGKDGKMFVSWGPDCQGEGQIVAWEPEKRIAWQEPMALVEFTVEA